MPWLRSWGTEDPTADRPGWERRMSWQRRRESILVHTPGDSLGREA